MAISPILNKIFNKMDMKKYLAFIVFSGIFLYIVPLVFPLYNFLDYRVYIVHFAYLYLVGGYIKKFVNVSYISNIILVISFIYSYIFGIVFYNKLAVQGYDFKALFGMGSFFLIVCSFCLFVFFLKLDIKDNAKINEISSYVFGVYLLHDTTYREKIHGIINLGQYYGTPWLGVFILLYGISLFLMCLLLEFIYVKLIHVHIVNMIDKSRNRVIDIQ